MRFQRSQKLHYAVQHFFAFVGKGLVHFGKHAVYASSRTKTMFM